MIVLKESDVFLLFDQRGMALERRQGLHRRDQRLLAHYAWSADGLTFGAAQTHEAQLNQDATGKNIAARRTLSLEELGLHDAWVAENTGAAPQNLTVTCALQPDFDDLFAYYARRGGANLPRPSVGWTVGDGFAEFRATAEDGISVRLGVQAAGAGIARDGDRLVLTWALALAPGESGGTRLSLTWAADDDGPALQALPSYSAWRRPLARLRVPPAPMPVLRQAADDLRMLLLKTNAGPYPAAGLPSFSTFFGRDALITAMMVMPLWPAMGLSVLRFLAAHQGREINAFREEAPGKILHEIRRGPWGRTGRIPFGRYYGAADSTPLFILALERYLDVTSNHEALLALRPAWEMALAAILATLDGDGLPAFTPSGSGLAVQSWKDSPDSLRHADGSMAQAPFRVAQIAAYSAAAFRATAGFYDRLKERKQAGEWAARADALFFSLHRRFWSDDLGTYVGAIDGAGAPLKTLTSDAGHLLWLGAVPAARAAAVAESLLSPALWSGWGLRTLGAGETAYDPDSYHRGGVWPHDTALFAWGLHRYGFRAGFEQVAQALFEWANAMPMGRLPELIAGHSRVPGAGPVAYPHACAPQAWAAAGLLLVADLWDR